jgi:hypothetical protein
MPDFWTEELTPSPDVLHQELGGETVLLNLANEQYFGLDAVGTRVWQLLVETRRAPDVMARLQQEFDVTPEQLQADLRALLSELVDAGLVRVGAG